MYLSKLCLIRQKSTACFSFSGAREEEVCTEDGTVLLYILGFLIVLIIVTHFNCLDIFELVCCFILSVLAGSINIFKLTNLMKNKSHKKLFLHQYKRTY